MVPAGFGNDDLVLPRMAGSDPREPRMSERSERPAKVGAVNHHILSVLVQNRPGVLARVAGLFARA